MTSPRKAITSLMQADLAWWHHHIGLTDGHTAVMQMIDAFDGGLTAAGACDLLVGLVPPTQQPRYITPATGFAPNHQPVAGERPAVLDLWLQAARETGYGQIPRPPAGHDVDTDRIAADYLARTIPVRPHLPTSASSRGASCTCCGHRAANRDAGTHDGYRPCRTARNAPAGYTPHLVDNHTDTLRLSPETLARVQELHEWLSRRP